MEIVIDTTSLTYDNFNHQKQELLNLLGFFSTKSTFPSSFIKNLKKHKNFYILGDFVKGYNSCVNEAIKLISQLAMIKSWGIFFNSYNSWKTNIRAISISINKYTREILNYTKNLTLTKIKLNSPQSIIDIEKIKNLLQDIKG